MKEKQILQIRFFMLLINFIPSMIYTMHTGENKETSSLHTTINNHEQKNQSITAAKKASIEKTSPENSQEPFNKINKNSISPAIETLNNNMNNSSYYQDPLTPSQQSLDISTAQSTQSNNRSGSISFTTKSLIPFASENKITTTRDSWGNDTTIKTKNNKPIETTTTTQIKTTSINHKTNNGIIVTKSGEKISFDAKGDYRMEKGNNIVKIKGKKGKTIKNIDTTNPLITKIEYNDDSFMTISESTNRDGKLLVTEQVRNEPIVVKSFLEDGTVYSSKHDGNRLIEQFNNDPEIITTTTDGETISTITNKKRTTSIKQNNFILTITTSFDAGFFRTGLMKNKTTIIDFSNYIDALRKAKTREDQVKIMDEMTIKMTGNKDLINSPEYLTFRDEHIQRLKAPNEKLTLTSQSIVEWFTNCYKRLFSEHYKLMEIQNKITQEQNNNIKNATVNRTTKSITLKDKVTYQNGMFMFTLPGKDKSSIIFDATSGQIVSGKSTIPTSKAKQMIQTIDNKTSIITMAKDNITPLSKAEFNPTKNTIEFFVADKNGVFADRPTSTLIINDNSIRVEMVKPQTILNKSKTAFIEMSLTDTQTIKKQGFNDKNTIIYENNA